MLPIARVEGARQACECGAWRKAMTDLTKKIESSLVTWLKEVETLSILCVKLIVQFNAKCAHGSQCCPFPLYWNSVVVHLQPRYEGGRKTTPPRRRKKTTYAKYNKRGPRKSNRKRRTTWDCEAAESNGQCEKDDGCCVVYSQCKAEKENGRWTKT